MQHQASKTAEANKAIVLDFIEKAINQGDIEAAAAHFGEGYVQHNPAIADGPEGFIAYVRRLRQTFPQVKGEVRRIFAEGDFVVAHLFARREPDEDGLVIVDIFRLDAGKLVEHWEVRQPFTQGELHGNSMV
jgi:predicted SnoaL-like aldol condensation-catalyzing enzyme